MSTMIWTYHDLPIVVSVMGQKLHDEPIFSSFYDKNAMQQCSTMQCGVEIRRVCVCSFLLAGGKPV